MKFFQKFVLPLLILTFIIALAVFLAYQFQLIPHCSFSSEDFGIIPYQSPFDADQDGLDDQTDLLISARTYLATKPRYKSQYYATGYPNDNYGVCTDVVAFALLGTGYDLQTLFHHDLIDHPDAYDIPTPDQNIDFRRTPNLEIFFSRHAENLTTELSDPADWQPGDLVIFDHAHIAILSDLRNSRGFPFLLHHHSPFQIRYEEDSLSSYGKITSHFRLQPLEQ